MGGCLGRCAGRYQFHPDDGVHGAAQEGQYRETEAPRQISVLIKIEREFLTFDPDSVGASLVSAVHSCEPSSEFWFRLPTEFQADAVDGRVEDVEQVVVTASREDGVYRLCVARHPPSARVAFRKDAEGSKWTMVPVGGDAYILQSCDFPGYKLTNQNGRLGLVKEVTGRNDEIRFFPRRKSER